MAEPNNHELDPDGDLVLILHPSSSGYKNVVHDAPSEGMVKPTRLYYFSSLYLADPQPLNISEEPNAVEEPAAGSVVEGAAAGTAAERFFANSDDPILGGHKTALIPDEKDLCHAVRIRVSSKHLTLASPVFRTMFKVIYKEGLNLHSQGHAELPLPDDNPAAFLIILHLIHGQIRKVPRKIDLWMLTELAILVDKYELLETVEMWLDYWLQDLESTIPLTLNNDLLPWICISWVFRKSAILKKVTKIAQTESQGLLEANQLPIPECVLSKNLCCM